MNGYPTSHLDAALEYAARGWHVLPVYAARQTESGPRCSCGEVDCAHIGKHPRTEHGVNDATTDEATIREWWRTWPDANIGIATGAASGFAVLDVDPRSGGDRALGEFTQQHGPLPPTLTVETGGGGQHYYFKLDGLEKAKNGEMVPGLDFKTTGGYVIAPPSTHASGKSYAWRPGCAPNEGSVATAPEWFRKLALASRKKPKTKPKGGLGQLGRSSTPPPSFVSGGRNNTLTSVGGSLRRAGCDERMIRDHLLSMNAKLCTPPLEAEEVGKIANSLMRYQPGGVDRYQFLPNGIFRTEDGTAGSQISNFHATIVTEVVHDDAQERTRFYEMEGRCCPNGPLVKFVVSGAKFESANWWNEQLGVHAILQPGRSAEAHLRAAIRSHSTDVATRVVYVHTGWRKIGGAWYYLHAAGGIGAKGNRADVCVQLPGDLERYSLPSPVGGAVRERAFAAFRRLLLVASPGLIYPLALLPFVAVLGRADYGVHLAGKTGTFKSAIAAVVQSFFGRRFDARSLPGSWVSTANALEELAYLAKDAVSVFDDYKPSGDYRADAQLAEKADRLFRGLGNGAGRSRLSPEMQLRAGRPPRGVVLSTGEDTPPGESLRARLLNIDVRPGDVASGELTAMQDAAEEGLFALITSEFCQWAAPKLDELTRARVRRVRELRGEFQNCHARVASMMADLVAVAEILWLFFAEVGRDSVLPMPSQQEFITELTGSLGTASAEQARAQRDEDPVERFIATFRSLLDSDKGHLRTPEGGKPQCSGAGWRKNDEAGGWEPQGRCLGWVTPTELYVEPETAYREVNKALPPRRQLPVGEVTLRRRLNEAGLIGRREGERESFVVRLTLGGRRSKVLVLRPIDFGIAFEGEVTE